MIKRITILLITVAALAVSSVTVAQKANTDANVFGDVQSEG